jgi:hypothetical protein
MGAMPPVDKYSLRSAYFVPSKLAKRLDADQSSIKRAALAFHYNRL